MEFQQVITRRRMVRAYRDRPVPAEIRERILGNALHAPSAGFTQGWEFLVLEDEADRRRFWDAEWPPPRDGSRTAITTAPLLIIPFSHKQAYLDRYAEPDKGWTDRDEARWPVPFWHIDAGFASMIMLLTVVDQGLGALFFGVTETEAVRAVFGVPDTFTPIGGLAIGYPAEDHPSPSLKRGRRPVEVVAHRGTW